MKKIKRFFSLLTAFTVAFTLLSVTPAVKALGDEVNTGLYYFINKATGEYLTLKENGDTENNEIITYAAEADAVSQVFKIKSSGDLYKIQPAESTTKFITPQGGANAGAAIKLVSSNSESTQKWYFHKVSDNAYTLRSGADYSLALTADRSSTKLEKYVENDTCQQWELAEFSLKKQGDSEKITAYGIDVSKHQGEINWTAVKEYGVEFAIIRIGYSEVLDPYFEQNYKEAVANGIDVGVYLYSYNVTVSEAKRDAEQVLKWLDGKQLDMPVFYDIEDEQYQGGLETSLRTEMCIAFMEIIKAGGYETGVYANQNWFNNKLNLSEMQPYGDMWLAKWPASNQADEDNSHFDLWQFRSDGKIAGIKGDVDINVSFKTTVNRIKISACKIDPISDKTFTGEARLPNVRVYYNGKRLTLNKDYTLSGKNNVNAGTATLIINGIGNFQGRVTQNFVIKAASIKKASITGVKDTKYTAKARTLKNLKLKIGNTLLKKGTDYTVTYKNNVNLGTAKVIIKAKGKNVTGSITKTFNIIPKAVTGVTVKSVGRKTLKISWDKIRYADGYRVYRSTSKDGVYKKVYSTSNKDNLSFTDTNLSEGTYYFYKVRAFSKTDNGKMSGFLSAAKKNKTKISDTDFTLKYSKSKKKLYVKINKDTSVTGYIVYMYNSKTKAFEEVYRGSDTVYTKKNVKSGKTYKFKIKTYKITEYGTISGKVTKIKKIET